MAGGYLKGTPEFRAYLEGWQAAKEAVESERRASEEVARFKITNARLAMRLVAIRNEVRGREDIEEDGSPNVFKRIAQILDQEAPSERNSLGASEGALVVRMRRMAARMLADKNKHPAWHAGVEALLRVVLHEGSIPEDAVPAHSGWVAVEDRMPERGDVVLVQVAANLNNPTRWIGSGRYAYDEFDEVTRWSVASPLGWSHPVKVTHWMPVPTTTQEFVEDPLRWIAVTDRLPDRSGEYLIWDGEDYEAARWNDGDFYRLIGTEPPTHWMPIRLEPPMQENGGGASK